VLPNRHCPVVPAVVAPMAEVPLPNNTPLEVKVAAPVPPLGTPKVPVVIALASIAIAVLVTAVTLPWASVVNTGTWEAEP